MKRNLSSIVVLIVGILFIFGCSSPMTNTTESSTNPSKHNQILFADEFDSLNTQVWSSFPSLTPFDGSEGSKMPGEVIVENGLLKLSRYAPEIQGENPASLIQSKNTVALPETFLATMRFRNEYTAFGFGSVFIQIYHHKIRIERRGPNGVASDTYDYPYNDNSFFMLSFDVSKEGYTIRIKEDVPNATETEFSQQVDMSEFLGNSTITIWGGSNTQSAQYSEIDYIRINQ